jgi:hypothetical protein
VRAAQVATVVLAVRWATAVLDVVVLGLDPRTHLRLKPDLSYQVRILASRHHGTLYIGIMGDLVRRVWTPAMTMGGAREPIAVVVVHHLDQARAALAAAAELGCVIELRSAPGAAGYAGVGYLKALGDEAGHELLIDCGDDAGLVMAALRTGCRRMAFSGSAELGRRLADMAEQVGATLVVEAQAPEVVMLQPEDDAAAVVRARLSGVK